jgi:biopolymer transport protein ExbB/TolQ
MREFQLCLACAVGGAFLIGLLGTVLGLPFLLAALAGFAACFAAARKGVMDVIGGRS